MHYLLGIDIGTSSVKVVLFDEDGREVTSDTSAYQVYYPAKGWAEQDPDEWWTQTAASIRRVIEKSGVSPADICGVGTDGQSWSAVAVDSDMNVLCRTPIWMDTRCEEITEGINRRIGADRIFSLSGNTLRPSYTTGKIIWYRENHPDIYRNIRYILQSNSFIVLRLTGVPSQDLSQGYGLSCFDMRKGTWDTAMARELGIPEDFLPQIFPCHGIVGKVTEKAAAETGLLVGTPVVAGGLDAACGTLGTGVIDDGQTQEQGGQAGGMSICSSTCVADPSLITSFHVVPDRWLLQGGTVGGSGVMRWLSENFADGEKALSEETGKSVFELLTDGAAKVPAGSDGLTFLPYMSGERSPIWDPSAQGVWFGIDFAKTKAHFVRSALEGTVYALRHNIETAEQSGAKVGVLMAMGGASKSPFWTQMKADITGKEITVAASGTETALGAAILAGVGTGLFDSFESAVAKTVRTTAHYSPDASKAAAYDRGYAVYRRLYTDLKGLMHDTYSNAERVD